MWVSLKTLGIFTSCGVDLREEGTGPSAMGADLCSTLGGRRTGPIILEILYAKPCILGDISAERVHFALLNTDVEVFLNQLYYYRQLYNVDSFYYYWKHSQIISSMAKYWRGHYLSCPQTNYWGICPPVPRFRPPMPQPHHVQTKRCSTWPPILCMEPACCFWNTLQLILSQALRRRISRKWT